MVRNGALATMSHDLVVGYDGRDKGRASVEKEFDRFIIQKRTMLDRIHTGPQRVLDAQVADRVRASRAASHMCHLNTRRHLFSGQLGSSDRNSRWCVHSGRG